MSAVFQMDDRIEPATDAERATNDIDPELDIHSNAFNPLKALLTEKKLTLHDKAPIYDNISIFESRMKRTGLNTTSNESTTDLQRYVWMQ